MRAGWLLPSLQDFIITKFLMFLVFMMPQEGLKVIIKVIQKIILINFAELVKTIAGS